MINTFKRKGNRGLGNLRCHEKEATEAGFVSVHVILMNDNFSVIKERHRT